MFSSSLLTGPCTGARTSVDRKLVVCGRDIPRPMGLADDSVKKRLTKFSGVWYVESKVSDSPPCEQGYIQLVKQEHALILVDDDPGLMQRSRSSYPMCVGYCTLSPVP